MPVYCFKCPNCEDVLDYEVSLSYLKEHYQDNTDNIKLSCEECSTSMNRDYYQETQGQVIVSKRDVLKPLQLGAHAEDWKKDRAIKIAQHIAEEPIDGKGELDDIKGVCAEEEKARGKTPGSLTNGVSAPRSKEQREAIIERDRKKRDDSIRKRRKAGV